MMRISSISVIIALPFILLVILTGYGLFINEKSTYFYPFIAFVILLVAIYTLQPHIDFLWDKKYPKTLEDKDKVFLQGFSSFYNNLSEDDKTKFEQRVYVFIRSKSFKLVKKEQKELPQDFKIAIASTAIQLSFELNDYLFKKFDHYFVYDHPFPSPKIQFLHSVEVDTEDKMVIFDIELLINSLNIKNNIFNIGLFAFSEIFHKIKGNTLLFSELNDKIYWEKIYKIANFNKEYLEQILGFLPPYQFSILSTLFFTHKTNFEIELPIQFNELKLIYNIY